MKKMILSVTFLLALASVTNAADTKQTAVKSAVENKVDYSFKASTIAVASYEAVLEENTKLRLQTAELANKLDDLSSKLDYSQMMHVTISNLQEVSLLNSVENASLQSDYARMMNAVIVNLVSVSANTK